SLSAPASSSRTAARTRSRACPARGRSTRWRTAPKRRRSKGRNGVGELSIRERDVLALVAKGLSNDEIAARLYLSVRTVERHLSNIYAKLRVTGKAARAAAAARFSVSR